MTILNPDPLRSAADAVVEPLLRLAGLPASSALLDAAATVVLAVGIVLFADALDRLDAILRPAPGAASPAWLRVPTRVGVALAAAVALWWLHGHPSPGLTAFVVRWDQMAFAGLAGLLLADRPATRRWFLAVLSLRFLLHASGPGPVAMVLVVLTAGLVLLRLPGLGGPRATAVAHVALWAAVLAHLFRLRWTDVQLASATWALLAWMVLRHASFVVETRKGRPASAGAYFFYQLFYPSLLASTQVYGEFASWNVESGPRFARRAAARRIAAGAPLFWLGNQLRLPYEVLFDARGVVALWTTVFHMFVASACYLMGFWAISEGVAALYGVALRPNFDGVLTATNPGQFWRAWRGTMTNWFIRYVYVPLGGRDRQVRNIALVFVASTAWHWVDAVLATDHLSLGLFPGIGMWGLVNAVGVIGHALWRRRTPTVLPAGTPAVVRTASKIVLAMAFGSFTITLLGYPRGRVHEFGPFLLRLAGLGWLLPAP